MYSKQTNLKGEYFRNKMWSLKGLVMLQCKSGTSLHAVQYTRQPGSVLMFCPYYFRNFEILVDSVNNFMETVRSISP